MYYTRHPNASIDCGGSVLELGEVQAKKHIETGSQAFPLPSAEAILADVEAFVTRNYITGN
jgi:hypothetical protein